ncbi:MAG: 16S rRNA (guanine(527)-N(7))-methyltransferase RsmG [Ruminococcaceae bacterium]|nr:16S rRNA (guanine(527)-N(7))-methyltransferase RsmG [Oscillospiraceae bacterium]
MSFSEITKKYRPSLTESECKSLDIIGNCLAEKNQVMNLTALTDEKGVGLLHFWDSLTLLDTNLFKNASVIDVGCGGGFPSLPLALCSENCVITSNDATAKKLTYVAETAEKAGVNNINTLCGRAEELGVMPEYRESFDIAVARGVARLNVLCEWCMPFVKVGGYFVAMKGEKGKEEADEAKKAISVLGGELVDIMQITVPEFDYLHTLVVIKKVKQTPKTYPRRNSQIQKKPL